MKNFYFLSGLPRAGTKVLASVVKQHPDVCVSNTSGLLKMLIGTLKAWSESTVDNIFHNNNEIKQILKTIFETKYLKTNKSIIFDYAPGWASVPSIEMIKNVLECEPKIVIAMRNVEDCVASLVKKENPKNLEFFLREDESIVELKKTYQMIQAAHALFPKNILFVDYDDFVNDPKKEIEIINDFLGLPKFEYDISCVKPYTKQSKEILDVWHDQFVQPRFWKPNSIVNTEIKLLDKQLAAGLVGKFEEGWEIAKELAFKEPWNHRAAFNRGWYMMWKGHLLEGQKLLDRGRIEKVYGNGVPITPMPIWDGVSKGTVLLNLEGGFGDQIHGVRFAKDIADRGCEVIVACSAELALIFKNIPSIKTVVQHEAVFGVVHDFWVPSMSAIVPLGYEYADLSGKPYINKPEAEQHHGMRIGLRWQGNPMFEHEQHRLFPPKLMFDALQDVQADFISLQRDEGSHHRPSWVREVPLNHWGQTQKEIASCDLVITSCTSVAHLSAAMGIPTWIVVPILPYYLWAKPGSKTPWYDSVTLFRQEIFGDWTGPFNKIKSKLSEFQKKQA